MVVLPAGGPARGALLPQGRGGTPQQIAMGTSLLVLLLAILATVAFDPDGPRFQLSTSVSWIPGFGVNFALGVDGIALVMLLLIGVLMPLVVLTSWRDTAPARHSMRGF